MKNTTTYREHHTTLDLEYNPLTGRVAGKSFMNMMSMFTSVSYTVKVMRTRIKKGSRKGKTRTIVLRKPTETIDNYLWIN